MKIQPSIPSVAPSSTTPAERVTSQPTPAAPKVEGFQAPRAAPATDLEGTSHGYVAPNKVESPFTSDEKVQLARKIPCPALAGAFNAGMLKVAKDGTVKIPDLERTLGQLGAGGLVTKVLTSAADATDDVKGSFNLFKLNGSNLDHTGSTGIRQNGVHPERFEKLMSFSKDGQRLTAKDLADAAESFAKEDPGLRGRITQQAELTAVLKIFGRTAEDGSKYFTRDDAKSLFVDGQIPASWEPPAVPGKKVGLGEVLGGTALGLFRQLVNGQ